MSAIVAQAWVPLALFTSQPPVPPLTVMGAAAEAVTVKPHWSSSLVAPGYASAVQPSSMVASGAAFGLCRGFVAGCFC